VPKSFLTSKFWNSQNLSFKYKKKFLNVKLNTFIFESVRKLDSGTAVEHSPHHPKVKGLSLAATADTGREKMLKK
jgi:hypothetical protein